MRILLRVLTALLAAAVAAAGGLLAAEVAWPWARHGATPLLVPWPAWRDRLAGLTWQDDAVRFGAGVAVAAGMLLLLIAAAARRRDVVLLDPTDEVSVRTSPRSLARIVGVRVRAQDNVVGASVTATARRVRVRAVSRLETEEQLQPRLQDVAEAALREVPLAYQPKVSVVVSSPRDRR